MSPSNDSTHDRKSAPEKEQTVQLYCVPVQATTDELSLADVLAAIRESRRLVLAIVLVCVGVSVALALWLPRIYQAEVVIVPVADEQRSLGMSALGQLGGLVSLAGIDLGVGGSQAEAVATLKSRAFIREFIEQEHLLPVLFADEWDPSAQRWRVEDDEIPTLADGVALFRKKILAVTEDKKTGIVRLSIEWRDPVQAAEWANALVRRINVRLRQKDIEEAQSRIDYLNRELKKTTVVELREAIYRLIESQIKHIMVASTRSEYAFRVIDPAVPPLKPAKPRKRALIIIGVATGFLFAGIAVWLRRTLRSIVAAG